MVLDSSSILVKLGLESKVSEPSRSCKLTQNVSKRGIIHQAAMTQEHVGSAMTTPCSEEAGKLCCHMSRAVLLPKGFG